MRKKTSIGKCPKITSRNIKDNNKVIDIHLTEYDALRREIEFHLRAQQDLVNYSIAITAATTSLFAFGKPPIAEQMPFLLLVVSILLSSINLAIVDMGYGMQDLGTYIQMELAPKVQNIVGGQDDKDCFSVLSWEKKRTITTERLLFRGITTLGKYTVGYLPSILTIILFFYFKQQNQAQWLGYDKVLFSFAIFLAILVPISGIVNSLHLVKRIKRK